MSKKTGRLTGTQVAKALKAAGFRLFIPRDALRSERARRSGIPSPDHCETQGSFKIQAPTDSDFIYVRAMRTPAVEDREARLQEFRSALMKVGVTNTRIRWVQREEQIDFAVLPERHRVLIVPRRQALAVILEIES